MFVGRRGGDGMGPGRRVHTCGEVGLRINLGFPVTLSEDTGPLESSFTHLLKKPSQLGEDGKNLLMH